MEILLNETIHGPVVVRVQVQGDVVKIGLRRDNFRTRINEAMSKVGKRPVYRLLSCINDVLQSED